MTATDETALMIYVLMGRDPTNALDLIKECSDIDVLLTLRQLLNTPGTAKTDHELNALMLPSVQRRLDDLSSIITCQTCKTRFEHIEHPLRPGVIIASKCACVFDLPETRT